MESPSITRARAWLAACPGAISGDRGHDQAFYAAVSLVKGFSLEMNDALGLLTEWNACCEPEWSEEELLHKIESALDAEDRQEPGYLLRSRAWVGAAVAKPVTFKSPSYDYSRFKNERIALCGLEQFGMIEDWSVEALSASSPMKLPVGADENFEAFLGVWSSDMPIWMGDVKESSEKSDRYRVNFAPPSSWKSRGLPKGMFTSGCTFQPGSFSRCKEQVLSNEFAIIESDRVSYSRQTGIIRYLMNRGYKFKMVVDTMGSSLHGWMCLKGLDPAHIERLCTFLCGLHDGLEEVDGKRKRRFKGGMGCDPSTFRSSQPCRLPGATRPADPENGKRGGIQQIIYLNN